ncbi:tRNA-splicing endonuclease subunit sen54 [Arachnomyces sp. PD_36]|nr:tRNA-splicing endonuclease subunit sen54 [Arachnomyces sp. PD_36]
MADLDEEAITTPATFQDTSNIDNDLSDETQDFRFLNHPAFLSNPLQQQQASIPRRGDKDFEPNPTLHQSDTLTASRNAMHNALSYPRLHNPSTQLIGIYCPDGKLAPPKSANLQPVDEEDSETPSTARTALLSRATGVGKGTCVCVPNPKGQTFRTVGASDRWNRAWLLPEEAIYLLERASLDIRWPDTEVKDGEEDVGGGIPMSLQAAYTCFIGREGLTLERYVVYAGLRRGGYTVMRAESWDEKVEDGEDEVAGREVVRKDSSGIMGFLVRLFKSICVDSTRSTAYGPMIGLGIYRSYNHIYRALSLNLDQKPSTVPSPSPPKTTPPFRIAFNAYKPSTPFKKSSPPTPDFRIAVINTNTQPTVPTLSQLSALLESTPPDPPKGEKMDRLLYLRLRHGWRNVILAVVDQGVVSFLRVADARFGGEKLYEEKIKGGNKGGGAGRGRGRGRGGGGRGGGRGRGG